MMGKTPDGDPDHPADARRRDRRLDVAEQMIKHLHRQGAWRPQPAAAPSRDRDLHPVRRDPGRAPRDPPGGDQCRRAEGLSDRGADGGGDRRRACR